MDSFSMAIRILIEEFLRDGFLVVESRDNHTTAHGDSRVLSSRPEEQCAYPKVNEPLLALPHP